MEQNTTDRSNDTTTTRSTQVQGQDASEIFNKKQLQGDHVKIEEVFDEELYLNAFLFVPSPKGEFAVLGVNKRENEASLTISNGSHVVLEKLRLLSVGVNPDDFGVFKFKTPYRIKLVERKSSLGKTYHDIESWS